MISEIELNQDYTKVNNDIEKLEIKLQELKDHKVRLRYFYQKFYKKEVLKN